MKFSVEIHAENYLHMHADCIPVKGASRSVICDLTRNEIIFFPTEYYEVLEFLASDKIGNLFSSLECEEERKVIIEFIEFLDRHEFIIFLKDISMFPPIEERWDMPAIIQNAIIDTDEVYHDFEKIFRELDELGCQFVQIRSFSDLLKLKDIYHLLSFSHHKSIRGVELILKYDTTTCDESYIELMESQPIISSLTLHSSPEGRNLIVDYGCDDNQGRYIKKQISIITQCIDSQIHCGVISVKMLNAPSVSNFFETKLFNGCLNRKVSIDALGEIKNCPSMPASFGNIVNTDLKLAINMAGFKDKWTITKDEIKVCKDCEFRYVCSDCRAYVEDPEDNYSKPLKCGYNPYTCEWEEWSQNSLKQRAINYYGMKELTGKENVSQAAVSI